MTIFSFLPLLLALVAYAGLAKLAARLFRRTKISWRATLLLAGTIFILSVLVGAVVPAIGMPVVLSLPVGIALHVILVALFFSRFATTADDLALNPIAAAKLAGVFLGLSLVLFGGMWLLATTLLRLR